MTVGRVEWVLVVRYGSAAHRATYGRLPGTLYSKDFIQLSRKVEFVEELRAILPELKIKPRAALTYRWPGGTATGTLVKVSADRPHLSWVTSVGAPAPWRMAKAPDEFTIETIRGNPDHTGEAAADKELEQLHTSGFGQPFLLAVKLRGEDAALHLRVLVDNPDPKFEWCNLRNAPPEIQDLADRTRPRSVLASRLFEADYALYFDTEVKGDPWRDDFDAAGGALVGGQLPPTSGTNSQTSVLVSDANAEALEHSEQEVLELEEQVQNGNFSVPDSTATVKTRGSAQRVFAERVKKNYKWRCALTGIQTPHFLIASHIVPWSVDESIRLDPANGICLSVLADRAFEHGYISINDDLSVSVEWGLVGGDKELAQQLASFDGAKLQTPKECPPKIEYLERRRSIHQSSAKP